MPEPLILVPGVLCDARGLTDILTPLSRARAVTLAPSWIGDRVEEIASDLLTAAPARFALAGHDLGGAVALEVLRRAPERVTRVALIGTNPLPDTPQEAGDREPQIIAARTGRFEELLERQLLPRLFPPGPERNAQAIRVAEMALDLGAEVFARQWRALQRRRDQQSTLRRISQPALVVAGSEDAVVPNKRQAFAAELIPYAQYEEIAGAGHMPMIDAPERLAYVLEQWMRQPLVLR